MNKLLIAVLLVVSTQAIAEVELTTAQRLELCDTYEKVSRQIMTIRQDKSMSLKQVLDIMNEGVSRRIVMEAWEQPSFSTEAMQKNHVQKFADNIYLQCLKSNKL